MGILADRVKELREGLGLSQSELAERASMTQQGVQAIEKGKVDRPTKLRELARALRARPEYLMGEVDADPTYSTDDPAAPDADIPEPDIPGVSTLKPYQAAIPGASPDVDVSAGAGPGGLSLPASTGKGGVIYSADAIRGEIYLPNYLLSEFTRAHSPRIHWVAVRGDSMTPTLNAGERVMVDTTDTSTAQGGVFVVRDPDGEIMVKRVRKLPAGQVELVSDNPAQGNMVFDAEEISVIGRVVGRLGRI